MERRGDRGRQGLRCQLLPITMRLCLLCFVLSVRAGGTPLFSFSQFFDNDTTLTAHADCLLNKANRSYVLNANSVGSSTGSCGLLYYGRGDVRIQNRATGKVASFSTSFTFKSTTPAQRPVWDDFNSSASDLGTVLNFGMTDTRIQASWVSSWVKLRPCQFDLKSKNSFGVGFMTNYDYNKGQVSNNFIELGDYRNRPVFQPGSTYNLCGNKTHCSYLTNGGSFTAWIDYTAERSVEVRLLNGSYPHEGKPREPLFVYPNFALPPDMGEYIAFGIYGSSAVNHIEVHEVSSWTFSISNVEQEMAPGNNWLAPVSGVSGVIAALTVLIVLSLWLQKRRKERERTSCATLKSPVFSYRELLRATKNFSESEIIGRGGFGTVYRASFGDTKLAVKRIHYEAKHAETTFHSEISSLGLVRHRNVVQLQGWFHEKDRLLLIYEYMPNGSLNKWLHKSEPSRSNLSWALRHRILKEVATALEHLHTHCLQCVLHRDVKSSNVLLDADLRAHLGDFGLARLMDHQKNDRTTMAAGTLGYMAPEMPYTGKATKESDVYSFGILVLEVVCGREPLDLKAPEPEDIVLLYSVWRAQEADTLLSVADPRLLRAKSNETQPSSSHELHHVCNQDITPILNAEDDDVDVDVQELIKSLLHLGLLCCLPNPKLRPAMEQVVQILQQIDDTGSVNHVIKSMPPLPKTKPLGLYTSMEFSQTADSIILESSHVSFSHSSRIGSNVDELNNW